jgi:hypothetical protein
MILLLGEVSGGDEATRAVTVLKCVRACWCYFVCCEEQQRFCCDRKEQVGSNLRRHIQHTAPTISSIDARIPDLARWFIIMVGTEQK